MPKFGRRSKEKLETADPILQNLFRVVIQFIDCSIIFGNRESAEQFELFKKGRSFIDNKWVITDKSKVVTYKDGFREKSKHNYLPSKAVDVVPYPIDWEDREKAYYFAGIVKGIAYMMGIKVRWGGDWDSDNDLKDQTFNDLWHWEIVE